MTTNAPNDAAPKKRFIAGAICPQCQLLDKIVVYQLDAGEYCECVRCGYRQQQEVDPQPQVTKIGRKEHTVRIVRTISKKDVL